MDIGRGGEKLVWMGVGGGRRRVVELVRSADVLLGGMLGREMEERRLRRIAEVRVGGRLGLGMDVWGDGWSRETCWRRDVVVSEGVGLSKVGMEVREMSRSERR